MRKIMTFIGILAISSSVFAASGPICIKEALRNSRVIYSSDFGNDADVTTKATFVRFLDNGVEKLEVWSVSMVQNSAYHPHIWSHSLTLLPQPSRDPSVFSQCLLLNFDREDFLLSKDLYKDVK